MNEPHDEDWEVNPHPALIVAVKVFYYILYCVAIYHYLR